jgi:CelD/BcsL family acetyltransferase involved in cellulose biosynthesis
LFAIHYIGWPQAIEPLAAFARSKHIPLIEDCALSMFAEENGRPIGTTGDYSIFCLYKTLPVPNGGLLVQNRNILEGLEKLRLQPTDSTSVVGRSLELGLETLSTHAEPLGKGLMAVKRAIGAVLNAAKVKRANVGDVGFDFERANLAMSPICHRLLERIDFESIPAKRRILYARLADRLRGRTTFLFDEAGPGTCPLFFPLLVSDKKTATEELQRRGIGAVEFWNTGHPEVDPRTSGDARFLREHLIELPVHQDVTFEGIDYIADQVLALGLGMEAPRPITPVSEAIEVEVVRGTIDAADGLRAEWASLNDEGGAGEPFLRPEWTSAYLRAFEPNAELLLLTARRGGALRGVLPLIDEWTTFVGFPVHKLRFPANIHSLRADLIHGTDDAAQVTRAIWEKLKQLPGWHVLEIRDVPERGEAQQLLDLADAEDWPIGRWHSMDSPYLPLSPSILRGEEVIGDTTSKFRANLRRRLRNLEARGPVTMRRVERADAELLRAFYELERSGWKGDAGSAIAQNPATKRYYDELADVAARLGMLTFYLLEQNGRPIAMQFGLTAGGRYYISKPAYDETFADCSPGQLLMAKVIRDAAERGLTEIDFLGMSMPWKADWTRRTRRHEFCYIFRNSSYGAALRAAKFQLVPLAKQALAEAQVGRAA